MRKLSSSSLSASSRVASSFRGVGRTGPGRKSCLIPSTGVVVVPFRELAVTHVVFTAVPSAGQKMNSSRKEVHKMLTAPSSRDRHEDKGRDKDRDKDRGDN